MLIIAQGYEVSEDELALDLNEFRSKYSDPLGYPEYAKTLRLTPSSPEERQSTN
jgi:hypothetical protein